MGVELEPPKDNREISLSVEVATPGNLTPWLGGAKLSLAVKRSYEHRARGFLTSVAAAGDVTEDEVIENIETGGPFGDVFSEGLRYAIESGDEPYRNTFARFVAEALRDTARIDTVSFLMSRMGQLTPAELRAFWLLHRAQRATSSKQREDLIPWITNQMCTERAVVAELIDRIIDLGLLFDIPSTHPRVIEFTELGELALRVAGDIDDSLIFPSGWVPPQ